MNQPSQSKHTGKKIWYGAVIVLSVLLLIFSAVGVVGAWVMQSKLSDATVSLFQAAENIAGKAQEVIAQVKGPLEEIQQVSANVAEASTQLSQKVQDEGLLKLLLPAEQEQNLVDLAAKVQDTLATIHEVLSIAANLYQAIDQIPFINLPTPDMDKVTSVEQTVSEIRISIEELKGTVAEVRSGAAEKIGVVTEIATQISSQVAEVLDKLTALDAALAGFQQTLAEVRSAVPTVFAIVTLLLTLVLVFVAYTQVEMIRLFVGRWRLLGAAPASLPQETAALAEVASPVEEAPSPLIDEKPASAGSGESEAQK
jgi:hypothetical protein